MGQLVAFFRPLPGRLVMMGRLTRGIAIWGMLLSGAAEARPIVILIGGNHSDPSPAQLAGKTGRRGNSGLWRMKGDLLVHDQLEAEYFNWNGTRAGKIDHPQPAGAAGIVGVIRKLRAQRPEAPIIIIGNSWGGHTAWQVCRALNGETVDPENGGQRSIDSSTLRDVTPDGVPGPVSDATSSPPGSEDARATDGQAASGTRHAKAVSGMSWHESGAGCRGQERSGWPRAEERRIPGPSAALLTLPPEPSHSRKLSELDTSQNCASETPGSSAAANVPPRVPVELVVFLDPSSFGRTKNPNPTALPQNVRGAINYFTRNSFSWSAWPNEPRIKNIDLGDPANGFTYPGGPKYDSALNWGAHVSAEWDERIHADIRKQIRAVVNPDASR